MEHQRNKSQHSESMGDRNYKFNKKKTREKLRVLQSSEEVLSHLVPLKLTALGLQENKKFSNGSKAF